MRMGYNSITDTIKIHVNGYIFHYQMSALEVLRTWLLSYGVAIQMPADHGDRTVVLLHTCLLFWQSPITSKLEFDGRVSATKVV